MDKPTRRSFLGGALTLVAVTALPKGLLAEALPTLYGDGVHCDAAGVEALAAGKPFRTLDGFCGTARDGELIGANLLFKRSCIITSMHGRGFYMANCYINSVCEDTALKADPLVTITWDSSNG